MELIPITDADDPRISDYTRLTDVDLRTSREPAEGLCMAEGELVINRAVEAGHSVKSMLVTEEKADRYASEFAFVDASLFVARQEIVQSITGYPVHRGALASLHRPQPLSVRDLCERTNSLVVLEDLVDHTNVGAIFRTAAGLGYDGVLLSPRCADPLYRRAIKVSMAATLVVPWARATDWPADLTNLGDRFTTIGLSPDGETEIGDVGPIDRPALVVGTEGDGLQPGTLAVCRKTVRIQMNRQIDSLNVAAATAVACYAFRSR